MKYRNHITINLGREKVILLFDNTDYLSQWQEGLKSYEHTGGKRGEVGSTARIVYEGRKGDLHIMGTTTKRNLPEEICISYKAKGVSNKVINLFSETEAGQTTWEVINTFHFGGLMALMAPFMKSAFMANTILNMERFKLFAEQNKGEEKNKTTNKI